MKKKLLIVGILGIISSNIYAQSTCDSSSDPNCQMSSTPPVDCTVTPENPSCLPITTPNTGSNDITFLTLDFGNQAVNSTSTEKTMTVRNKGVTPVNLSLHLDNEKDFGITESNTCTQQLLPVGGECQVGVVFEPTTVGVLQATLTVASGDEIWVRVALKGMGETVKTDEELPPVLPDFGSTQFLPNITSNPELPPASSGTTTPPLIFTNAASAELLPVAAPSPVSAAVDLNLLSLGEFIQLTADQIAALPLEVVQNLTVEQITALSSEALKGFNVAQLAVLSPEVKAALTAAQRNEMPLFILDPVYEEDSIEEESVDAHSVSGNEKNACDSPTVKSVGSGKWFKDASQVWSTQTMPGPDDLVLIKANHIIMADKKITVNQLCVEGVLQAATQRRSGLPKPLIVWAFQSPSSGIRGAIYNAGKILGKDGQPAKSTKTNDQKGGDVRLRTDYFTNTATGEIQAGRGGDDIAYEIPGDALGGAGGNIFIFASQKWENFGKIGPEERPIRNPEQPVPTGIICSGKSSELSSGDGGIGSKWNGFWGESAQWAEGKPVGGQGGSVKIRGFDIFNGNRIAAGYGGDACNYWNNGQAQGGLGGQVEIIPSRMGSFTGIAGIDGGGGNVWIEPTILISGQKVHIYNSQNVTIFGDDESTLTLSGLREGAIEATETITLAVGKGGVVDLRGNAGKVLKAGAGVKIFADTVLLDEGTTLQDLSDAPSVETHPSKILYHATLQGLGPVSGQVGSVMPLEFSLSNGGPTVDTYTLTLSDTAGWSLGTLPTQVTVEGLQSMELRINVTLPVTVGEDVVTLTATSQNEPNLVATTVITVTAEKEADEMEDEVVSPLPSEKCPPTGMIDFRCDNYGQVIADATLGPRAIIAGGELAGTIYNEGFISQVTLRPETLLIGGMLSGYIVNQGTLMDFNFVGASITGGTLAGTVTNASKAGGTLIDVTFAPHAHLRGGRVKGEIKGDPNAPTRLEQVRILTGSHLSGVELGLGTIQEK